MIPISGPVPSHAIYAPSSVSHALISDHTDLFACDDPSDMAHYLQYAPLQPSRTILGSQPSTSAEEMLYPGSPLRSQCLNNSEALQVTGLGIRGHDGRMEPLDSNTGMAAALTTDPTPSPLSHQSTYGAVPARYDMAHDYRNPDSTLSGGAKGLEMQTRSDFDAVYKPHHRTSARRGPFKDHEKREKTAQTRRIGSCIRCRMQRIRVSL